MLKHLFSSVLLSLFFINASNACNCNEVANLTIVECRKFDCILFCTIDSVYPCENGKSKAVASIAKMFKGDYKDIIRFNFDCSSACLMNFISGEKWILYLRLNQQTGKYDVNLCDRNRKYFKDMKDDYYFSNTGISFKQEMEYLKKNIGLKISNTDSKQKSIDITQRINEDTSGFGKIILLVISLFLFLTLFFLVNKYLK